MAQRDVGHAVLIPGPDGGGAVAFEVAAAWRRQGIAGALLARLIVSVELEARATP
jgi:GNAT superfamily N-acetyltransferase